MKVAGEYTFEAPQSVVWEALQDPAVLKATLPEPLYHFVTQAGGAFDAPLDGSRLPGC